MTLTGRQIREARHLLGWGRVRFSQKASVTQAMVAAIESSDGPAWLTEEQESDIRSALEAADVCLPTVDRVSCKSHTSELHRR